MGFTSDRDFIESIGTMNDPGRARAESLQRSCHRLEQRPMPDTDELKWSTRRIGQWTKESKSRVHAELSSNLCHARGRAMKKRGKHETDTVFIQTTLHRFGPGSRVYAKRFEDIGTTGMRSRGARAVFGHRQARTCNDKGSRSR